jgi:tetratricopeptide (TPR) repeat protein
MSTTNELRVFISSTFRDLQEEREHLVKKIFPEIRALCRQRGITFTEVDLRWGLTEEDVVLGQVIRTCLEEIDKCRPYFIGITGERYGYVPELHEYYKDPELLQRWPWIEEAAMDGSSLIDLEFRHAVLNDPAAGNGRVYFYFRRQRRQLDDADSDNAEMQQLDQLKRRVRAIELPIEEYRDPVSLGELVYDELIEIIKRDFAESKPPTPLEEEQSKHRAFAASRVRAYIPNPDYLKRLNEWIASEEQPLVLYAESGSGKSSLVAFWCDQLRRRQPDLFIIEHYVGIGAGDSDHLGIIRHIMQEIRERFDRSEELPTKPEELERAFANWLGFNAGSPMLLVIDGINQLSGRALDLHWLPPVMPAGVKLIISSTVEQTLVGLRKRGWEELGMQPLKERERESVVVRFLAEYHKALMSDQVLQIAEDAKCSHPLFLRTLLEEMRLHGTHEHLERTLTTLLSTTGTEDLFQRVLERLEDDYSQKVVREVMSLLWCSRGGLSELELAELTGISRLKLSTLLLGLDYHLVRRDGLLGFFHDYLRRAVGKRYLPEESRRVAGHRQLAEHFQRQEPSLRMARELLWQYEQIGDDAGVVDVLARLEVLRLLWSRGDEYEVLGQWSRLSAKGHDPEAVYRESLERYINDETQSAGHVAVLETIGMLLERLGVWSGAIEVYERMLTLAIQQGDRARGASAEHLLGIMKLRRGEYKEALQRLEHARNLYEEQNDRIGISSVFGNIGVVYYNLGEYDRALECYQRKLSIAEELGDHRNIAYAIGNIGILYSDRGEYDRALECYQQQLSSAEELGDRFGVSLVLGNMGNVYTARGEYDRALESLQKKLSIAEALGDRSAVTNAIGNMSLVYSARGEYDRALECLKQSLSMSEALNDRRGNAIGVGNMGNAYFHLGEYDRALGCYQRALQEHREIGFRYGVTYWLDGRARLLLKCVEQQGMPEYLLEHLSGITAESWRTEMLSAAREDAEECRVISEELSKPDTLFSSNILLAQLDAAEGDRDRADERLRAMLDDAAGDDPRAELHYWLWKLNVAEGDHQAEAVSLYQMLLEKTPKHDYRKRIEELTAPTSMEASDATE